MKLAVWVFLLVGSAAAFSPPKPVSSVQDGVKKAFASFALVSTVLTNFAAVVPAEAYYYGTGSDALDSSSQVLLAARSGGRAGGRARSAPSRAAPPTRVIERQTTVIQQPSYGGGMAIMAPPPMYMAPPAPSGLGLALGLNAVSGISEGFREARQENEIRSTQQQLTEARIKEAEMEVRSSTSRRRRLRSDCCCCCRF